MLISLNIGSRLSIFPSGKIRLPWGIFSDNVLQNYEHWTFKCITLSEVRHDNYPSPNPTTRLTLCPEPMLDDPAAGCRNALLHSLGSTVSGRSWLLQQLHPQRGLVHPSFHSSIRKERPLVLSRYRFLPCGDVNQNPHFPDHPESCRYERGDAWGDSPVPFAMGSW